MKKLTAKLSALTLVASALLIASPTTAQGTRPAHADGASDVSVLAGVQSITLNRKSVAEGRVTFKVTTSSAEGTSVSLFRLANHATLARFKADLLEVFNEATGAMGTRHLKRDARFFGLAAVTKVTPAKVTVDLEAGTYHLMTISGGGPETPPVFTFTTLTVSKSKDGGGGGDHSGHDATIKMTSAKTFDSPKILPARGSIRVRNEGNTLHFMEVVPVKKGIKDADIQTFFDRNGEGPVPFLETPGGGLDVLSPGNRAELAQTLPAGRYVLMCFMPDEKTGIPHAVKGMHKVVTLK
jgi:hypothetical protein